MSRFPQNILRNRLKRFQEIMAEKNIDAVMIRTLSSYIYFTGIKWLRPSLLIPVDDEPIAFIARGEEEGFLRKTWIKNYITYVDGGDLMRKVSSYIRGNKYNVVGLEYSVERDSYILFYEMFKRLNPMIEIVDVSEILDEMKMIKDEYELEAIRKAGAKARKAIEKAYSIVKPGLSETEVAGEIASLLYRLGSEDPKIYVNAGPYPRIHAEPLYDEKLVENSFVTIVVGADHDGYYANKSVSIYLGTVSGRVKEILEGVEEAYSVADKYTRPGKRFIDVIKELDKIYGKHGLLEYRVIGYVHSIGLKVEETPITTIVPKHRFITIKENMVLSYIHAPLMINGLGQVKKEDTFIVSRDKNIPIT